MKRRAFLSNITQIAIAITTAGRMTFQPDLVELKKLTVNSSYKDTLYEVIYITYTDEGHWETINLHKFRGLLIPQTTHKHHATQKENRSQTC